MAGPLEGFRIVDLTAFITGPLATMILADQGAEVIKVDRPGPPDYDSPADAVFNRGKERLKLDLKTPEGLTTAKKLVEAVLARKREVGK